MIIGDIIRTSRFGQVSTISDWGLANAEHVGVSSVQHWVFAVPGSRALPVRVATESAEAPVDRFERRGINPRVVKITVVNENRSARHIPVIVSLRAGLGVTIEAVLLLLSAAAALVLVILARVAVSVLDPVCACAEDLLGLVVHISLPALGTAYSAVSEVLGGLFSDDELRSNLNFLSGLSGDAKQGGSDERL